MAQNPSEPPKGKVVISLHQLWVEVEHESSYPDQLSDLSNRAMELFVSALHHCKEMSMDIRDTDAFIFDGDDEED